MKYCRALFITMICSGLMACGITSTSGTTQRSIDSSALQNVTWEWVETITPARTTKARKPQNYTLKLFADGSLQAKFDCNRGGGRYTMNAGKIHFDQMFSTRMACLPDSQDSAYMKDLNLVVGFYIQDDILHLEMPIGSGVMKFRKEKADE